MKNKINLVCNVFFIVFIVLYILSSIFRFRIYVHSVYFSTVVSVYYFSVLVSIIISLFTNKKLQPSDGFGYKLLRVFVNIFRIMLFWYVIMLWVFSTLLHSDSYDRNNIIKDPSSSKTVMIRSYSVFEADKIEVYTMHIGCIAKHVQTYNFSSEQSISEPTVTWKDYNTLEINCKVYDRSPDKHEAKEVTYSCIVD